MRWILLAAVLLALFALGPRLRREHHRCDHGASSIGPVVISDGHVSGVSDAARTGC